MLLKDLNIKKIIFSITLILNISSNFISLNGYKNSFYKIEESYLNSFKTELTRSDVQKSYDFETGQVDNNKLEEIVNEKFIIPRHYTQIILKPVVSSLRYSNIANYECNIDVCQVESVLNRLLLINT